MEYKTAPFKRAAAGPRHEQRSFLFALADSPNFDPVGDDAHMRDLLVFCFAHSRMNLGRFAEACSTPEAVMNDWLKGNELPKTAERSAVIHQCRYAALGPD